MFNTTFQITYAEPFTGRIVVDHYDSALYNVGMPIDGAIKKSLLTLINTIILINQGLWNAVIYSHATTKIGLHEYDSPSSSVAYYNKI